MKKESELEGAIRRFLIASEDVIVHTVARAEMAKCLKFMMSLANKKRIDLVTARIANRATIDRWLAGSHMPSPSSRHSIVAYFRQTEISHDNDSDARFLATILQNDRYRLAIRFLADQGALDSVNE